MDAAQLAEHSTGSGTAMDGLGAAGFDRDEAAGAEHEVHADPPPAIGSDERRMHVRAYNFWVSLLGGRAYPAIGDLAPGTAADFGPHSVLLDFSDGADDPAVAYLGDALRRECAPDRAIHTIADVPARSLLSRLTDHYLQILANRAPIGFEAEFVNGRGNNTMYRGILMPFSSDGERIDFVYGVINWKELAEPEFAAGVAAAIGPALADAPVWADGPGAGLDDAAHPAVPAADAELADRLAAARASAELAQGATLRSRSALYRALGLAYDFALAADARPADYAELLQDAGLKAQARAPMTAVVKLVFGARFDKARVTEFAAALSQARRIALPAGRFAAHVDAQPGGLKALVAAERQCRRPADAVPSRGDIERAALRRATPLARLELPSDGAEFVLLLARKEPAGGLAVLAPVPAAAGLVDRAIRSVTR